MLVIFIFAIISICFCYSKSALIEYSPTPDVAYYNFKVRYGKTVADKFDPPCYDPCFTVSGAMPPYKIIPFKVRIDQGSLLLHDHSLLINTTFAYRVM